MNNRIVGRFSKITIIDHSKETKLQRSFNSMSLWWRGCQNIMRLKRLLRRTVEGNNFSNPDLRSGRR